MRETTTTNDFDNANGDFRNGAEQIVSSSDGSGNRKQSTRNSSETTSTGIMSAQQRKSILLEGVFDTPKQIPSIKQKMNTSYNSIEQATNSNNLN